MPQAASNDDGRGPSSDGETRILHVGKATLGRQNMGRAARRADFVDAFGQSVDIAIDRGADAVVVTGRLFQSRSPDRTTVAELQSELKRLRSADVPLYLVYGPKEVETDRTHLDSLARSDLIVPIGGNCVGVTSDVALYGVDAGYAGRVDPDPVSDADDRTFLLALGDADVQRGGETVETVASRLSVDPDAVLAGRRTEPVDRTIDGVRYVDPGATEHHLSQTTIDEEPPTPGVNEYRIADGSLSIRRHELDARPFETFRFEATEETTLADIETEIDECDLSGAAILAELVGPDTGTPSREAVQQLLADRAFCARVYDERTPVEGPTSSDGADDGSDREVVPDDSDREAVPDDSDRETAPDDDADALLATLLTALDGLDEPPTFDAWETEDLADAYAALAELKSRADSLRTDARDELATRLGAGETTSGAVGSVSGYERTRRQLKPGDAVASVLRDRGVDPATVTTERVDAEKVAELVDDDSVAVDESDVFDVETSEYVRKEDIETDGSLSERRDIGPYTVYLGDGADTGGWVPVEGRVVVDEIVPLVEANEVTDERAPSISVNFDSEVSISGWTAVDPAVVRERIEPLVREHRVE